MCGLHFKNQSLRYALFFLFLAHIPLIASSQSLGKDWLLVRDENAVKSWRLHSNPEVNGTFQFSERKKTLHWNKIKKEEFFKNFEENKKKLLSFIGVNDWTAQKYTWINTGDTPELSVIGTYKNSSGQLIQFRELHIFEEKKTFQILYTQPAEAMLDPKIGESFVKDVKESVGNK